MRELAHVEQRDEWTVCVCVVFVAQRMYIKSENWEPVSAVCEGGFGRNKQGQESGDMGS